MTEKRKNDCYWLGKEDACMNRETHPDHTYDPRTLGFIPLEPVCEQKPGCGYMPKPPRRSRGRCRWYDPVSEYCGVPQEVPGRPVKNSIIHWSVRCQGVRKRCGYEERKEQEA